MRIFTSGFSFLILVVLVATLLSGCDTKNDSDLIPAYIHIDRIGLNATYDQGTASHKITDAWVYIDETLIGAFELPATVPVLYTGEHTITIRPGIKLNGIANTRSIYPFYTDIKKKMFLVADSISAFNDTITSYKSNVTFPWLENFDFSGTTLDTTRKSTVALTKINDPALVFHTTGEANNYSGFVSLKADTSVFEAATTQRFEFPGNGASVFLEMNYKINQSLVVGVYYTASGVRVQRPLLILNKTDDWKKVYVNLTVPKYDTPSATEFQIFFGAQKEESVSEGQIFLDNLKLVHF